MDVYRKLVDVLSNPQRAYHKTFFVPLTMFKVSYRDHFTDYFSAYIEHQAFVAPLTSLFTFRVRTQAKKLAGLEVPDYNTPHRKLIPDHFTQNNFKCSDTHGKQLNYNKTVFNYNIVIFDIIHRIYIMYVNNCISAHTTTEKY